MKLKSGYKKDRFILNGLVWWAGDNIYIEREKYFGEQKYEEICLNDYIKEKVKENSKVVIMIEVL